MVEKASLACWASSQGPACIHFPFACTCLPQCMQGYYDSVYIKTNRARIALPKVITLLVNDQQVSGWVGLPTTTTPISGDYF